MIDHFLTGKWDLHAYVGRVSRGGEGYRRQMSGASEDGKFEKLALQVLAPKCIRLGTWLMSGMPPVPAPTNNH